MTWSGIVTGEGTEGQWIGMDTETGIVLEVSDLTEAVGAAGEAEPQK